MPVHIVRLGTPRHAGEGPRLGSVRRPPRGVPKADLARRDFYDVWLPILAPSEALLREARSGLDETAAFARFARRFLRELRALDASRTLDLLAVLSHSASFSLGCYCAEESRCHRSVLRAELERRGADVA